MPDEVQIVIKLKRDVSEEVKANIQEYLGDFYGPTSQTPMDLLAVVEEIPNAG